MEPFRKQFKSFQNAGEGDCLFESFRQSLQLLDLVIKMRSNMVQRLEQAPSQTRIAQLNEHIMREIEAENTDYMGWGMDGGDGLDETARTTIISEKFNDLWTLYRDDMLHNSAYGGGAEAVTLANLYGVNLTVWQHSERNGNATHLTTYLQIPPAPKTVHLLSLKNVHYEATNLPDTAYPQLTVPSSQQAVSTRSGQCRQSASESSNPEPPAPLNNTPPATALTSQLQSIDHPSTQPELEILLRPSITDYCGLVLNAKKYFQAILNEIKIYEVRVISRLKLPPRIIFHPNRFVQADGYIQNIEAMIHPHEHEKMYSNAEQLLAATQNGKQLGMTEDETRLFVSEAKKKNKTVTFYLYKLSEPKVSQIQWIDHRTCNQNVFSMHQFISQTGPVTLFHWPEPLNTCQVLDSLLLVNSLFCTSSS